MLRQLVLHGLIGICLGKGLFTYRDCSNSSNKLIHIENVTLSADPFRFPGNETGGVDVQILHPISGSHFDLHVRAQKHVWNGYVEMPCLTQSDGSKIGACTYPLCDTLGTDNTNPSGRCPAEISQSTPGFPCNCPFSPGNYHLNPTTFFISNPSGFWKFLGQGDYKVKATITNTYTGEEVACYVFSFITESRCFSIKNLGDYKVKATITDTYTGEEVACYVFSFTTESDCSGISCIIG